jgi:hypothetical protein
LALAHADLGQFGDAWRCVDDALTLIEKTKERWCEAEVNRIAGEIAFESPQPDAAKAETYFQRAFAVARAQQAKSWELRAAMSLARIWRDQGPPPARSGQGIVAGETIVPEVASSQRSKHGCLTSDKGHERRFKRKSCTSALPPIADIIAASYRFGELSV